MINNVTLIGRLTRDLDLRYTQSGTAVGTFTLAVNRNFTNASGNREADFINCVIWRKPAETLANYARKGSLIGITGRLQTRSYDNQQGQKVYVTEVVCESFQLLESKSKSNEQQNNTNINSNGMGNYAPSKYDVTDPFKNGKPLDISDDDLPFKKKKAAFFGCFFVL